MRIKNKSAGDKHVTWLDGRGRPQSLVVPAGGSAEVTEKQGLEISHQLEEDAALRAHFESGDLEVEKPEVAQPEEKPAGG